MYFNMVPKPMKRFRLLKETRQSTEYSCGASSLQAVLSYWGKNVDEAELMQLLGTTPEEGTYPEAILRVARSLGFEAELKENVKLAEVKRVTDRGEPVMVLGQMWRSGVPGDAPMSEEWDSGHWFIVLDVDNDYVYFEDPYTRMGKGFMPHELFEESWHNVMGGDLAKPKQIHVAVFIRGDQTIEPRRQWAANFSGLASGRYGSLNMLVTQFRGTVLTYDFVDDLKEVLTSGMLRPDAYIFMHRDAAGHLSAIEGGGVVEEAEVMEINAVIGALSGLVGGADAARARALMAGDAAAEGDFGLSVSELQRIAYRLPSEHSAIIVLFENLWERKFRDVAARHNGSVVSQRLITADALVQLGQQLGSDAGTEVIR